MALSHLPDWAKPRPAVDPELPEGVRKALLATGSGPGTRWAFGQAVRLARLHRARYVRPATLDADAKILLHRAQEAIDTVLDAEVNKAGLLDTADNALSLPAEEWEIAQAVLAQTRMRAEQQDLRDSDLTPMEKSRFAPQREALRRSVSAVAERVKALEEYADRTAAADRLYTAPAAPPPAAPPVPPAVDQRISELERRDAAYEDLHARTAAHELATDRISELAGDAEAVEDALRQAKEAGRRLDPRRQ